VLAFLVSSVFGILVGNRLTYILFVSSLSSVVFAGLGFGIYSVLQKKVPEFLEFLEGVVWSDFRLGGRGEESYEAELGASSSMVGASSGGMDSGGGSYGGASDVMTSRSTSKPTKVGDTLVIDKIVLKNEPKLMAEAIRTVLAKDDVQDS